MEKLNEKFIKEIKPSLLKDLGLNNPFRVPRVVKVVVSSGIGDYKEDDKMVEKISSLIAKITGLKPKVNRSTKAVSAFKLRIGQPVGLTATLRGEKMYDFIDRLISITLPRVRDFRGLPKKSFDKEGNYSIGIRDASIFPEVKMEEAIAQLGLQINFNTTARNAEEAMALFQKLGFPFEKGGKV